MMNSSKSTYLYLHGFASSPQSLKAQYIRESLAKLQIPLTIPDLNLNDFANLTLSRQIHQVSSLFPLTPIVLLGSSFGGLTAAYLGETYPQIKQLVLLAPAFGFLPRWLHQLGEANVKQWQKMGSLSVYHYGEKQMRPINFSFVIDMCQYSEEFLQRQVPTLILHGKYDAVIPIEHSRTYAQARPWVKLVEVESDHGMTDVLDVIWQEIQQFLLS